MIRYLSVLNMFYLFWFTTFSKLKRTMYTSTHKIISLNSGKNLLTTQLITAKQLIVSKTLFLFSWRKLVPKMFVKKWKTTQCWKRSYQCTHRNAELLRLVGATFDSKVPSFRRIRKKNLIILEVYRKKICYFLFYLFVVVDISVVKQHLKVCGKL